jgi:5-methylcytosine-specific restriction endonuclease McrA
MTPELVYVLISGVTKTPVRIFRTEKDARADSGFDLGLVVRWIRANAVEIIRRAVFVRDDWTCTHCGNPVTWDTGEMHERQWRGRGGEISLENSTTLCQHCHSKDKVAGHGTRQVQWSNHGLSARNI